MNTYESKLLAACNKSTRNLTENITFFVSMGVNSARATQLLTDNEGIAIKILSKLSTESFDDVVEECSVAAVDWYYNEDNNMIINYIFEDNSQLTLDEMNNRFL